MFVLASQTLAHGDPVLAAGNISGYHFVITLSLAIGCTLALWLAYQIARVTYHDFPLPLGPIALILLGSFLAAFVSTVLPARQAAQ